MASGIEKAKEIIVVEPTPIPTIYIDDILEIEIKGPLALFTFYEDKNSNLSPRVERHITARLLMRLDRVPGAARKALVETSGQMIGSVMNSVRSALHLN